MKLNTLYDSVDDIPETIEDFRSLFTEKGGKFELTGIAGIQTAANVERLQGGLTKERLDHKATKEKLSVWGDLDHTDVVAKLDRFPDLEAAASGKLDEAAIEEIVSKRVEGTLRSKLSPLERENKKLATVNQELTVANADFAQANTQRRVHDSVRKALTTAKVIPEAHEDALLLADRIFEITEEGAVVTRDQVGVAPGLDPAGWLTEIQEKRPHWWPASAGGGARGSGTGGNFSGKNPWSSENWNMTEQARIYRDKGQEYAGKMAVAAGTTIGGGRPAAKR